MTQTKFSISAASRIVGLSRPTISRHIKSKPISFEINEFGHKMIDRSELMRCYGDRCRFDREENRGQETATKRIELEAGRELGQVSVLHEQLVERYAEENEHLKQALDKALDYQNSVLKLLEDRSQSDSENWQASLDSLSEKVANQTAQQIQELKEIHDREILKMKRALHREANKSWWDKLFEKRRAGTGKRN